MPGLHDPVAALGWALPLDQGDPRFACWGPTVGTAEAAAPRLMVGAWRALPPGGATQLLPHIPPPRLLPALCGPPQVPGMVSSLPKLPRTTRP